MHSAEHVMTGGLRFKPLVEELLGISIGKVITQHDDIYLCHRNSVVSPKDMESYMNRVTKMIHSHSDLNHYFSNILTFFFNDFTFFIKNIIFSTKIVIPLH